jgi:glyoxylase-like metal-dependent hydrolase (beta-lactamase superfamily II)
VDEIRYLKRGMLAGTSGVAALLWAALAVAQHKTPYDRLNEVAAAAAITPQPVRGNVTMLSGSGGNIAVLTSADGQFLVDAGIAVSRDKIIEQLRRLGSGTPRYVVTTHWHWDHADGNSWARKLGATVIAHQGALRRLKQTIRVAEWEHTFTPTPADDLPNLILTQPKTITFGGEAVLIRPYAGPGHTDGDLSVTFTKADVLVTGDTFWKGYYPFVDYVGGGGIDSAIKAAERNIAMAGPRTLVIPGHGTVARRTDLVAFRDMLVAVRAKVAALKAQGLSLEEVVIAKPTAAYDATWGAGLVDGEQFVKLVYRGV